MKVSNLACCIFFLIYSIQADDFRSSSADLSNLHAPCFVDDVLAALRDSIGDDGQLTHQSLSLFGICSLPGQPSGSLLLELAQETRRRQKFGLETLHPVGGTAAAEQTSFVPVVSV